MAGWMNNDGLYVKFGSDEADLVKGGHYHTDSNHICEFDILYTDLLSATAAVLGSALATGDGSFGIAFPDGAVTEEIELLVVEAFTSSGTIGSATLELGLKKASDRSTALDADAFTTTSFVAGVIDAVGEKTVIRVGSTGAGSSIGVATTENGVIAVRNSAHATHPYTAGKVRVRIKYNFLA